MGWTGEWTSSPNKGKNFLWLLLGDTRAGNHSLTGLLLIHTYTPSLSLSQWGALVSQLGTLPLRRILCSGRVPGGGHVRVCRGPNAERSVCDAVPLRQLLRQYRHAEQRAIPSRPKIFLFKLILFLGLTRCVLV
jgi:hypothetical protein